MNPNEPATAPNEPTPAVAEAAHEQAATPPNALDANEAPTKTIPAPAAAE